MQIRTVDLHVSLMGETMVYLTHFWKGKLDSYLIPHILNFKILNVRGKEQHFKIVHLDIKGSLPEQARKPRDRGRDDFIEIRTDSPVCISDSLVRREMLREAAYILFAHPTGKHSTVVIFNLDGEAGTSTLF